MKTAKQILKIVVPLAIIGWLTHDLVTNDPETFEQLRSQPKRWGSLVLATACVLLANCIAFTRWYLLVRALGLPFRLQDAFRLGFLCYVLQFVSLGSAGGDLFRAVFVAREQKGRRPEAVASVLVDRVIGLMGLLLVASLAIFLISGRDLPAAIETINRGTILFTSIAVTCILVVLLPGFDSILEFLRRFLPSASILERLIRTMQLYRTNLATLLISVVMSLAAHIFMASGIFFLAHGLFTEAPTLLEHLVIGPLALVAAALPVAPAGLGQYEYAMKFLYDHLPASGLGQGKGFVVSLAYRVTTVVVALIGLAYYWSRRKEVAQVSEELRQEATTANS